MPGKLEKFLTSSPMAGRIKLPGKVVIYRRNLSPGKLLNLCIKKTELNIPERDLVCELDIGGQVLACGKLVKKKDGLFFKKTKIPGTGGEA